MSKRLFGSKEKEEINKIDSGPQEEPAPPTPPTPPPEPAVEIDPEDLKEVLSEITEFLNDVGLTDDDIVEASKGFGARSPEIPKYGSPGDYLVSAYTEDMFSAPMYADHHDLSDFQDHKRHIIHLLMAYSKRGMVVPMKTIDLDLLEYDLQPTLGSFGVHIDFSPHKYEESFQITIHKGDFIRTADVDQSTGEKNIDDKLDIIQHLIVDFGLIYIHMGGFRYFLFEREHLAAVRNKYGDFFDEVVNRP